VLSYWIALTNVCLLCRACVVNRLTWKYFCDFIGRIIWTTMPTMSCVCRHYADVEILLRSTTTWRSFSSRCLIQLVGKIFFLPLSEKSKRYLLSALRNKKSFSFALLLEIASYSRESLWFCCAAMRPWPAIIALSPTEDIAQTQ
jgi:hypothetical protein